MRWYAALLFLAFVQAEIAGEITLVPRETATSTTATTVPPSDAAGKSGIVPLIALSLAGIAAVLYIYRKYS